MELAHVCLVALVGYVLAGLLGAYFLVRFRRLHCVRQVQPWYCMVHYVCYGGVLVYLMFTGLIQRRHNGNEDGERMSAGTSPTLFGRVTTAFQHPPASRPWQVCEPLGPVALHVFLSQWARVTSAPPSPAAPTTIVPFCCLYEPLVQVIVATAFFSSFALLCNARWRYAVMGMAERQPGLWQAIVAVTATEATSAGPRSGTALAGASGEVNKHGVSVLDETASGAAAAPSPRMSGGSFVVPSNLAQWPLVVPRRRRARAPSHATSARIVGSSSQGGFEHCSGVTSVAIATEDAGEDDCPVNRTRAYHTKRRTGGGKATAAAAARRDGALVEEATASGSQGKFGQRGLRHPRPQQQYRRVTAFCEDDYDDIDDDGEERLRGRGPSSQAGHTVSFPSVRKNEGPPRSSRSLWRRLLCFSGWRLWSFSEYECEEDPASARRHGPASLEQRRRFQRLCRQLLAAFWLSDAVVVLLVYLFFALLAVARVAVAVAAASAWAATQASTAKESDGLVHGKGEAGQLVTVTVAAAVVPCPTECFVGIAGLLLLAAQRALLRRRMRGLQQILTLSAVAASASFAASAARRDSITARQQQLRQRLLRRSSRKLSCCGLHSSTDFLCIPSTGQQQRMEAAGSAARGGTATATSALLRFRHALAVSLLLLILQLLSDVVWAWVAAVWLTAGSAVASLADAVVDPLRWVSTEYRCLVSRTRWELFFSYSFTPFSLDLMNAHGQHVTGSMQASMPGSLGGLGLPGATGKEWLGCRSNSTCIAMSTAAIPTFSSRHRRFSTVQRSARVRAGGGRGPLGMSSRHGVPFSSRAASSLSTYSAATAASETLLAEGVADVVVGEDHERGGRLSDDAPGPHGMAGGGAAAATTISPIQFWHNVAVKVLQKSGKATGEVVGAAELRGGDDENGVGVFAAAAAETDSVDVRRSLVDGGCVGADEVRLHSGWAAAEDAAAPIPSSCFPSVADPFGRTPAAASALLDPTPAVVSPLGMLSTMPDMEHLNPASARFARENLKGSMLLALPTVARVGGKVEAAELETREQPTVSKREEQWAEEAAMGAQRRPASGAVALDWTPPDKNEENLEVGRPSADSAVPGALEGAGETQQPQSGPRDGWLSRALTTVVSSIAVTRCSSDCIDSDGAEAPSAQPDPASEALNASLYSFSSFSSSAVRAPIDHEEDFERFLNCVRRDGDNTYALQGLLAAGGSTYGQRVDAKGRGALHYAAMGGFVHGAIFLGRIGADPNVLDKAGYAPLHYAVLYHTEVRPSPRITDESPSAGAQEAPQILGIPVLETTAVQAAEQAKKRRQRHLQQQVEWVQAQLQAAHSAGSDAACGVESRISSGKSPQQPAPTASSHAADAGAAMSGTPSKSLTTLPLPIVIPPLLPSQPSKGVASAAARSTSSAFPDGDSMAIRTTTTAAAAAAVAAVVVPEEKGPLCSMAGALVHLGAQVDLPTVKGLTALHLAVMQGSIGLVNILLREGANPLLGPELEALSVAESSDTVARGASSYGRKRNKASSLNPKQQWQASTDTPQPTNNRGRGKASLISSESDDSHAASDDASGFFCTFMQRRKWVDVHITNAGNPIVNGHCKSPLLLAVELDADLVVASMLRHAALKTTAARVVAGLSPSLVPVAHVPEQPSSASLPAPQGVASVVAVVSMASDSPASRAQGCPPPAPLPFAAANIVGSHTGHSVAAAGFVDLSTSSALLSHASPASTAHPLADSIAEDAAVEFPLPISEAATAAVPASASSSNAHRPGSGRMPSHTVDVHDASFSSSTTTTAAVATALHSSTRTWWERCCPHGFSPLHIALVLGNAQATRVLLLRWCYAEDVAHSRNAAATPQRSLSGAKRLGGKAHESSSHGPCMTAIAALALPESVLVATTTVPPLMSPEATATSTAVTAASDDAASILVDFVSGAASSFNVGVVAAEQQQQQQPVLAHVTVPLAEEAEDSPLSMSGTSARGAAAAAPTATLSLVPSTGPVTFWVPPLRLNLFHLAAVGDSVECLAYVLRWRGAPDYVPCSLDDVYDDERHTAYPQCESTMALDAHQRRRPHQRQQKRRRAHRLRQAARNLSGVAESEAAVTTTEPNAPRTVEDVVPADRSSRRTSAAGANRRMASGEEVTAVETATLVVSIGELGAVSKQSPSLSAATAASQSAALVAAAPGWSSAPSSTGSRTVGTAESSFERHSDDTASSATSDIFNQTWSSDDFSVESSGADNAAAVPTASRRERRARAQQQAFVRALVTLLQPNIRVDAVRQRVRATVFGSNGGGGADGAIGRNFLRRPSGNGTLRKTAKPQSAKARRPSPPRRRMGRVDGKGGDDGNGSIMMANTCFGSTAAAAALHTGMTLCYATMSHPLGRHKSGFRSENGAGDCSSRSSSNDKHVQRRIDEESVELRELPRQTKEADRLRRLRQQRTRAFVSAVAKLRQSITGVPIDNTHLAAVETAVDRACASMTSVSARRSLQEALLIVTRRLQNQHRRARLASGLSCVAAAATAAADAASNHGDEQASHPESDNEYAVITTASATGDASTVSMRNVGGKGSDRGDEDGLRASATVTAGTSKSSSSSRSTRRKEGTEADSSRSGSSSSCPDSPLAASYYSSLHSATTTTATAMHESGSAEPAESPTASASDVGKHSCCRQESTLRLLRAISAELNAIDTRGLTPLHYAIANRNASMVYLLCAYGATFVFASEQTEVDLTGHSAEVIAATFAVDRHSGGGDAGASAEAGIEPATRQEDMLTPTANTNSMSPTPSLLPTAWTSAHAQRSAAAVTVATDALFSLGERYYAQLSLSTQEALRRAARSGSAEYLLLWMPTQDEREAERQLLAAPPVSETADTATASFQHIASPPAPHPPMSPAVPTNTIGSAASGRRHSPENDDLHSAQSPVVKPPSCLSVTSQQPATMAATLTAALGINDASLVTRATVAPSNAPMTSEGPFAKTMMMAGSASVDEGSGDAPLASLQAHLIDQDTKALQSMVAGKANRNGDDVSGEGFANSSRSPSPSLRSSCDADVSLSETKNETMVTVNAEAGKSSKQCAARETLLQCSVSSPPASATAVVPPSSSGAAAAAPEYTLLEPHDVFLIHVVRNPAKAESIVRAATEGTALRYLFLASVVSGDNL
ncbi:hypothetical protein CUR178_07957 [Leishmania enriettii]|uniref:Ankyrin repeat protein n=1 Tax=Leishmania enriettii TaxID=5663 RepID=A0A836KXJ4_LEIEN|nr:hypothetical protein CUR178_07957 [Leishmania enriettii]